MNTKPHNKSVGAFLATLGAKMYVANDEVYEENQTIELDKETVEKIVEYLWDLVLTTDSGEYAIQVGYLRDKLKEKLNELE